MARQRILQNNLLLWVDGNNNEDDTDTEHSWDSLRSVVYYITSFTCIDACIQFAQKIKREKIFIVTSGFLGQDLVPQIHQMAQVEAIYVFTSDPSRHRFWTKMWSKIRGVYNCMELIREALQAAVKQSNEDLTPISFVSETESNSEGMKVDLNRLEPSFMYTTLFKRILLGMEHEPYERQAIVKLCREQYADNRSQLDAVEEFYRDYRPDKAIWWYTRECFTYQMLNRALRLLESDVIVDMGFFIHDLHRQLEQLHYEQFANYHGAPLNLYRGQGLSIEDFIKLQKTRGGLIAFNSFLSTSKTKPISLAFAKQSSTRDNMVGLIFVMTVDPRIPTATFADVEKHSYFGKESEVLFSMHTVFRTTDIIALDDNQRLFEVRLVLTSEDDPELRRLTDRIEEDMGAGTGWHRLGQVLLDVGEVGKAEELYLALLWQKPTEEDEGAYYHQLGSIKDQQGAYKEAIRYYKLALSIRERILPSTDPLLATSYNSIGAVYDDMGDFSQALSYYNKALDIRLKTLSASHPDLATSYNNIGAVYDDMAQYTDALIYYNKALDIREKIFPPNHPDLATSYNNIGAVYDDMTDYAQALFYYNKALDIREKILPTHHPDLATSYNSIGAVYDDMRDYSQALAFYDRALNIREKILPEHHPDLATSYNSIGAVYDDMGDYSQALAYYNTARIIREKTFGTNHPDTAQSYDNIGGLHLKMEQYVEALFYLNKALDIRGETLPPNHPDLATSYSNIGETYLKLKEFSKALSYFLEALDKRKHTLPAGHIDIQTTMERIEFLHDEIEKKTLSHASSSR